MSQTTVYFYNDMDDQSASSKVNRLRNMFQHDKNSSATNSTSTRPSYNHNANLRPVPSPEIKRRREAGDTDRSRSQVKRNSTELSVPDASNMDPNKFYETTNHVQRFKYTRAIFAKMEQDTQAKIEQERRSRSRSPNQRSPSPKPPLPNDSVHPPYATKPRSGSDPSKMDKQEQQQQQQQQRKQQRERTPSQPDPPRELWTRPSRTGSVDHLSEEKPAQHWQHGAKTETSISRSETDLAKDEVESAVPSPKWLMQHYETETKKTGGAAQRSSPSRFLKSENKENKEVEDRRTKTATSASYTNNSKPTTDTTTTTTSGSRYHKDDKPRYKYNTDTGETTRTVTDSGVVLRNKYNRETSAAGGVLLHKRHSRDGQRLSKEEIEASLSEADLYWQKSFEKSSDLLDPKVMSESTYSSGSGEEMARSDSNHELSESPTSPIVEKFSNKYSSSKPRAAASASGNSSSRLSSTASDSELSPSAKSSSKSSSHDSIDNDSGYHGYSMKAKSSEDSLVDMETDVTTEVVSRSHVGLVLDLETEEVDGEKADYEDKPSPTESTSSATSSEPAEYDLVTASNEARTSEIQEEDHDFLERQSGDGHEEVPLEGEPDGDLVDNADDKVHMLDDGNFFFEIEGIPEADPDEEFYPSAKKPSRIKFSFGPIKVYSTYSVEEYDRKNEDVDPMAASAEYELEKRVERMDVFEVQLEKGPDGLGLSIIGMGVGADAGLEKLGIFIKTLTEAGAAQRDGRIQVNDQIIEVDGKSLVGVTQAYAATVLRNTSGKVKFLIGREKDPSKSEVARLIQQSLEQDRRRTEVRRQEIEEQQRRLEEAERRIMKERENHRSSNQFVEPDEAESPPPMEEEEADGAPLPVSASQQDSWSADLISPEEESSSAIETFDLAEDSSSESVTPDMDSQVLFIKLKESQYKNAVAEAELAKVKAKMIMLENSDSQKKHYEKKCEDMAGRLRDSERTLGTAQKEISHYQDILEGSQGQYIDLEKQLRGEYNGLEKKYAKAKKLIKEYQTREKDYVSEREAFVQQEQEKDQQYNGLVRSMKDRIFQLEGQLSETCRKAGLPPVVPSDSTKELSMPAPTESQKPREYKPVDAAELSEMSDTEMDSPDAPSPEKEEAPRARAPPPVVNGLEPVVTATTTTITKQELTSTRQEPGIKKEETNALNSVPETQLLDTSANKQKAQLVSSGALASRRLPTRHGSNEAQETEDVQEEVEEEDDDPFLQHDREASDDQSETSSISQSSYDPSRPTFSGMAAEIPDSSPPEGDQADSGGIVLISAKSKPEAASSLPGSSNRLFSGLSKPSSSSSSSSSGGIQLLSKRSLPNDFSESSSSLAGKAGGNNGGIQLISSRPLNTEYGSNISLTHRHENNAAGSTSMVSEHEMGSRAQSYDFASGALTNEDDSSTSSTNSSPMKRPSNAMYTYPSMPVPEWTPTDVCAWLVALEQDQYRQLFLDKAISGTDLLLLDQNKLKAMGMTNANDRKVLAKRIKDLKAAVEKEKKQWEKEQKARDKLEKQSAAKQKKKAGKTKA